MNPTEWREAERLTLEVLGNRIAEVIGRDYPVHPVVLCRYEKGKTQADTVIIEIIKELSGGRVTANDWHAVRLAYCRQNNRTGPLKRGMRTLATIER